MKEREGAGSSEDNNNKLQARLSARQGAAAAAAAAAEKRDQAVSGFPVALKQAIFLDLVLTSPFPRTTSPAPKARPRP